MNATGMSTIRRSLARQNRVLDGSIVLTPVDSFPIYGSAGEDLDRLDGLYATDRPRGEAERLKSKIWFSGRRRTSYDISSIYSTWSKALGAEDTSMRLLSGLHAHATIFMGLGDLGETVFLLPELAGGHFATAAILNRLGYRVVELPVDTRRFCVDKDIARALIAKHNGGILFIDRSEGLVYEDFSSLTGQPGLYCVYDASQYLSGILSKQYPSPFSMGFDLLISTLHKSFPGPQKALVATRCLDTRWERIKQAMSQFVSSHHVRSTYLAGLSLEKSEQLRIYAQNMLGNAVMLETALHEHGLPVVRRPTGLPPTQHLWVRFDNRESAYEACHQLELCRIHCNYRMLPYSLGYGLRLGTTAATLQGLNQNTIPRLATLIRDILRDGFTLHRRHAVRELAQQMTLDNKLCLNTSNSVLQEEA